MSDKEGKGRIKKTRPPTVASHDFACLREIKLRLSQRRLENYHGTETQTWSSMKHCRPSHYRVPHCASATHFHMK